MFPPIYISDFTLSQSNLIRSIILGEMNALILTLIDDTFMHWSRISVGDTVFPEILISS